ncbi:MAG: amidohydrolase [Chloroflexota bacterium]
MGPAAEVVDLDGQTAIPGLTDSHMHLLNYGLNLERVILNQVRSLGELTELVRARAATLHPGDWVVGRGWDQDRLAEHRYPTVADLDRVAPDNPVVLVRACGHLSVCNSLALRLAGVSRDTPDPDGGRIDRDEAGNPTGILREGAMGLVGRHIPTPDFAALKRALQAAMQRALAAGLTMVHTDDVGTAGGLEPAMALYDQTARAGDPPFRAQLEVSAKYVDDLIGRGLRTGDGDEWFRIGPLKLFADGSLGGGTAALSQPYADAPDSCGIPILTPEAMDAIVAKAHDNGLQVAIHAIGDRAAEIALNAIAKAQAGGPRTDLRHRIVHCQILRPDLIARFVRENVCADIQPKFITTDLHWAERRLGRDRLRWSYAWRDLLEAGVRCAGGSDAPVEPLEPFLGIYASVTRCDLDGQPAGGWLPEQRLTVEEALRLFTTGGAYVGHDERTRGMVAPGCQADLAVLSANPLRIDPFALKDIRVMMTVVGGRVAFRRQ